MTLTALIRATRAALEYRRVQDDVTLICASTQSNLPAPRAPITGGTPLACRTCDTTWSSHGGHRCFHCGRLGRTT
ncbi:MAG: hypothetical protein Q8K63_15870 [Acidimicrobiales bacterium]|nr:hypothetical protein [Acidimicrobiales bacterium]